MERECVSVIVIVRVSVKESVEMRVYGSESKNWSECGSDCESVGECVCVRLNLVVRWRAIVLKYE